MTEELAPFNKTINTPDLDVRKALMQICHSDDMKLESQFASVLFEYLDESEDQNWLGFSQQDLDAVRQFFLDFKLYMENR